MMAAQTAILYNGKRIIPAPELDFGKSFIRSADGSIIGSSHTVTLSGTLVGTKGWDFSSSPDFYTGSDYPSDDTGGDSFSNLVAMQDRMRELFAIGQDYHWFEVVGCSGVVRKWRARVTSVNFPAGRWTHTSQYSIQLELQDALVIEDDSLQLEHSENWSVKFEEEEGGVYRLTHTLSAQAQEFAEDYGNVHAGWQVAKTWVDTRLAGSDYTGNVPSTINNDIVFGSTGLNLVDYTAYDYTVERSIDEIGGTYSISETWTLAKDPVFKIWTTTLNQVRDGDTTVSIEGEFRSFLNRVSDTETDPTNANAALTAFNSWDAANSAYSLANTAYASHGCLTLSSCPVSRSITTTTELRGADTAFGQASRVVKFSYEFSDAASPADISLTTNVQTSLIGDCNTTVVINGNIQGHACGCDLTKFEQAQLAYNNINCDDEATSAYSGSGTLIKTSSSYTQNVTDGIIEFSCEFSDRGTEDGLREEKTTISWTCGELGSDGESKYKYSVDGSIQAYCSDVDIPEAPTPASYGFDATLRSTSVTTDEENRTVSWQYEWDDDTGLGLVDIVVEKSSGPENCDVIETKVSFSVEGNGCDSVSKLANAQSAIGSLSASLYAEPGSCQTYHNISTNRTQGTIEETYGFTTECDASVDITITTAIDNQYCDERESTTVEGNIVGNCFASGGAMVAAEAEFANYGVGAYATYGSLASSRISRNEKSGTISFTYDFREDTDVQEETITESWSCGDLASDGTSKTKYSVSGSIQGTCDGAMPSAPAPSTYGFDAVLTSRSVTSDADKKHISWQYDWDGDTGLGLVEITVDTSVGPDNCDVTNTTVEFSVTGTGCDSNTMIANARGALSSLDASDYAPSGSCQTSTQVRENLTRGSITKTYTFSTECDATLDLTITESYTTEECGEAQYNIEGQIQGLCFVTGGAFAAAESLFGSHGVSAYSSYGCMVSSRVVKNERNGIINFTYDFKDCTSGYKHEQTVSVRHDEQGCCSEIVVSGTITPYCDASTGRAGQIAVTEAAWSTIAASLSSTASGLCSETIRLSGTQVTANKYNGQLTYTYTYKCCDTILSGVFDESITISREYGADVIAIVPILGRANGPLIQDKGTKTAEKFSVSIQATFPKECGVLTSKPSGITTEVEDIISGVSCSGSALNTYVESDRESWNPSTGRYTRDVTFVCEYC
jgi:hypothetical protein